MRACEDVYSSASCLDDSQRSCTVLLAGSHARPLREPFRCSCASWALIAIAFPPSQTELPAQRLGQQSEQRLAWQLR